MCIFYSNPLTCREYEVATTPPRKELNYINFKGFRNPLFSPKFYYCKDMKFLY